MYLSTHDLSVTGQKYDKMNDDNKEGVNTCTKGKVLEESLFLSNLGQSFTSDTYNQHGNQQVLLSDLSMREDIVEHIGHVAFVLLTQCEHTLVIVSC